MEGLIKVHRGTTVGRLDVAGQYIAATAVIYYQSHYALIERCKRISACGHDSTRIHLELR